MNIESIEKFSEVFEFIGLNLSYQNPFIPNLPYLADVWHGSQVGMKLAVGTNRDEKNQIIGCIIALLIDVPKQVAIENNIWRICHVVNIGKTSKEDENFINQFSKQLLQD